MKNYLKIIVGSLLALVAGSAFAVGPYDTITASVSFTDLIAALGVVYAAFVLVGIFMKGGDKISKKVGF